MKYAIFHPADQTIMYLDINGKSTVSYKEAGLWDDIFTALMTAAQAEFTHFDCAKNTDPTEFEKVMAENISFKRADNTTPNDIWRSVTAFIEGVADEDEFRAEEDTW